MRLGWRFQIPRSLKPPSAAAKRQKKDVAIVQYPQADCNVADCNTTVPATTSNTATGNAAALVYGNRNDVVAAIPMEQQMLPEERDVQLEPTDKDDGQSISSHIPDCNGTEEQAADGRELAVTPRKHAALLQLSKETHGMVTVYKYDSRKHTQRNSTLIAVTSKIPRCTAADPINDHIVNCSMATIQARKYNGLVIFLRNDEILRRATDRMEARYLANRSCAAYCNRRTRKARYCPYSNPYSDPQIVKQRQSDLSSDATNTPCN